MKNNFLAKIYRTIFSIFPIEAKRKGKCKNCGVCCRLPIKCPFLNFNSEGKSYCSIYKYRPPQCRKYPRSKKEWITRKTCGYSFK